MFTIYLATCLANGKAYVGQTVSYLSKRRWAHENRVDYDCFFHRAIRKYGKGSFDWQVLGTVPTKVESDNLERLWISLLNTRDRSCGYNITAGGDGSIGVKHSAETRRKHSEALRRAHAEGRFPYRGGWKRVHSIETKRRISDGLRRHFATA